MSGGYTPNFFGSLTYIHALGGGFAGNESFASRAVDTIDVELPFLEVGDRRHVGEVLRLPSIV